MTHEAPQALRNGINSKAEASPIKLVYAALANLNHLVNLLEQTRTCRRAGEPGATEPLDRQQPESVAPMPSGVPEVSGPGFNWDL